MVFCNVSPQEFVLFLDVQCTNIMRNKFLSITKSFFQQLVLFNPLFSTPVPFSVRFHLQLQCYSVPEKDKDGY